MFALEIIISLLLKVLKLILNIIIIILYRVGDRGYFLGIGGTWNLNEEKNADCEIIASGIFVGFLIYTAVQLLTFAFGAEIHKKELSTTIMNFVGTCMWLSVGATALHYWNGYVPDYDYIYDGTERQVGLALGSLCILSSILYLADTLLPFVRFSKSKH